jgi:hypothetical protein
MLSQEEEEELAWEEFRGRQEEESASMEQEGEWLSEPWTSGPNPMSRWTDDNSSELEEMSDPELLHEFRWLIESASKLKYIFPTDNFVLEFIHRNLNFFKDLKAHGEQAPKYVGSGTYGTAWRLQDGNILKIMIGPDRALREYRQGVSSLFSGTPMADQEIMIHRTGLFDSPSDALGWAIMEGVVPDRELFSDISGRINFSGFIITLLNTLSGTVKTIVRNFIERSTGKTLGWKVAKIPMDHPQFETIINHIFDNVRQLIDSDPQYSEIIYSDAAQIESMINPEIQMADDWVEVLMKQMVVKLATGRTDLNPGNLGVRVLDSPHPSAKEQTGYFVYYDW